ncbi:MAG TPA: hydroxymethylglutaryl-CoA lyase [Hyphomicrobiaceae bacterium]|nr:hydroxymethylglutaryl-CoA lyase [Hyphomicrobiaceae bacterium]
MSKADRVELVEVAPRDGFQVVKALIPTETKLAVVDALAATGIGRIEIGAFVSPKAIPQMADIGEVLARAHLPDGVRTQVLVPNAKGAEMALAHGVKEIVWVVSVSESHNRSNVRRSHSESMRDFAAAWPVFAAQGAKLRFNLATCFDCPFEGRIAEGDVRRAIETVLATTRDVEIGICDTTGRAATDHVERLCRGVVGDYGGGPTTFAFHGHDTYALGVANAFAAFSAGIAVIDGAAAGLGGCPFAPGASGNTATEDLVFAFEHRGVATGVDLAKLLAAADLAYDCAPNDASGRLRSVPRERALAGFGAGTRGIPLAR